MDIADIRCLCTEIYESGDCHRECGTEGAGHIDTFQEIKS